MPQESHIFEVELPDGNILEIEAPSDTPPGVIRSRAKQFSQAAQSPDPRSAGQVALDQVRSVGRGIPQAVTGLPGAVAGGLGAFMQTVTGGGTSKGQEILKGMVSPVTTNVRGAGALVAPNSVQGPTPEEWTGAAEGAGANLGATVLAGALGRGGKAVARKIPTTEKAGTKFQSVMGEAKDVPIDTAVANEAVVRANELRQAGATMPKIFRDFQKAQKATDTPFSEIMTYKEGRDFASTAGRLSARETSSMTPSMQRQINVFSDAMRTANREAAAKVGMGKLYDQAMKEYRQAKRIEDVVKIGKKYAIRAAITAVGLKAAQEVIQ